MLVLLVIFMITAPLLTQGVKVNLPETNAKELSSRSQEPIVLSIDVNGKFYLNVSADPSVPLESNDIIHRVAAYLKSSNAQGKTRQVMVRADRYVDYGKVIQGMVLLQQAGAEQVGLVTNPTEQKRKA
jgi:biopolymer transport protein TolR